jgi:hypothetical protein
MFYGSYINVSRDDKVRCLENEMIRDLKVQLEEAKTETAMAKNDSANLIREFTAISNLLKDQGTELVQLQF